MPQQNAGGRGRHPQTTGNTRTPMREAERENASTSVPQAQSSRLTDSIEESLERLARETDAATLNTAVRRHLAAAAHMRHLSANNQLLVAIQGGTIAMTFKGWLSNGRCVRKGEKSHIWIFQPRHYDEETGKADRFGAVAVFDIPQTDSLTENGASLPAFFKSQANGQATQTYALLRAACTNLGIALELGDAAEYATLEYAYAYSAGGRIVLRDDMNPAQSCHALAHELAHEVLHWGHDRKTFTSHDAKEWQADATAVALMDWFGMDVADSAVYAALHNADGDKIRAQLAQVTAAVQKIINAAEPRPDQQRAGVAA